MKISSSLVACSSSSSLSSQAKLKLNIWQRNSNGYPKENPSLVLID